MKKAFILITVTMLLTVFALTGCGTAMAGLGGSSSASRPAMAPVNSANGSGEFHILRNNQLQSIPKGSVVGIIGGSGAMSTFMASALEDKGLVVRVIDLYALTSPTQKFMTDPRSNFVFMNDLVADSGKLMEILATTKENDAAANADVIKYIGDKLGTQDSIVVESQKVNHYLTLVEDLKKLIASMNVNYLVFVGPAYSELSFTTKIYSTASYNLVFSNLFVGTLDEWRKVIPRPKVDELLSYNFGDKKEPTPYWELSYCEYIASVLDVK